MRFIDKIPNQIHGNSLVTNFLTTRWAATGNSYSDINYSTHPNHPFRLLLRDDLRLLLLNEQSNLCCYCMRMIDPNTTTLEHIVPRSTNTQNELNRYLHYPIINTSVCLQSVFDNSTALRNTPPFPLEIAYENLTASCKGDFPGGPTYHICNHKRLNDFVEPLFYIPTIEHDITYGKAGILYSSKSTYDASIITLNLNYDSLERIRQVWYHISVIPIIEIENAATEADRNEILTLSLMGLSQLKRNQLIADFKTETFWNVLLQYKWFYQYYQIAYPIANR